MLPALMLAATLNGTPTDPLASAIEHYRTVDNYRVTIHASHDGGEEYIRYYYKKPGFVRMEFIRPHAGTVLIYDPHTLSVRLWPFGVRYFPGLNLNPGNPLIKSSSGQRVDHSDVGTLFENVRALRDGGSVEISGAESINGHTVLHLVVTGAHGFAFAGVHRYELWLDTASQFPIKVISRDPQDAVIETVMMEDLEINAALPETLFSP